MDHFQNIPNNELFDSTVNMLAVSVDDRVYHRVYLTCDYAVALVTEGSSEALSRAEKVIHAVLECQKLNAYDPHYGNFFWEKEEGIVEDLNAVEFVLIRFIPMVMRYGDRLTDSLLQRLQQAIRIALDEIARIDVGLIYTNIVAQDVVNSILGGHLFKEQRLIERGLKKLRNWQSFIDRNGIPHEYNSPVYTSVTITALSHLIDLTDDIEAKMIAKLIMIRLGISFALHLHPYTNRLAGPHCRAYYQFLTFQTLPEYDVLIQHIEQGHLPSWINRLVAERPTLMNIRETSDIDNKTSICTYHSQSFSLGTATRELDTQSNRYISNQSNVFSVQYTRGNDPLPGIVYSRYLLNDRWLGDYRTTLSRGNRDVFFDEGSFRSVQNGAKSINVYAPIGLGAWERCFSAKACLIWHDCSNVDEVWIDGTLTHELPIDVTNVKVIVVGSDDIYVAVLPLTLTDLGINAPIRLVEREEHLVLELYNYLGPTKTFWELAHPGAFFQGQPRCGFYTEVAEKSDYSSGAEFAQVVSKGKLFENFDPQITYDGNNERKWTVEYKRDNETLGIELDMMQFEIKQMWTHNESDMMPMLDSPIAIEQSNGEIRLGDASLTCGGEGARWLVSLPDSETWVAGYHGPGIGELRLTVPQGYVHFDKCSRAIVTWQQGNVYIDATDITGTPQIIGGTLKNLP